MKKSVNGIFVWFMLISLISLTGIFAVPPVPLPSDSPAPSPSSSPVPSPLPLPCFDSDDLDNPFIFGTVFSTPNNAYWDDQCVGFLSLQYLIQYRCYAFQYVVAGPLVDCRSLGPNMVCLGGTCTDINQLFLNNIKKNIGLILLIITILALVLFILFYYFWKIRKKKMKKRK